MRYTILKKFSFIFLLLICVSNQLYAQNCATVNATDSNGDSSLYLDCSYTLNNNCIDLSVDYTPIPSTDSYEVQSIPFTPPLSFDAGTSIKNDLINSVGDFQDRFSLAQELGFNYCFFNNFYDKLVIGSNGVFTFNLEEAGTYCASAISQPIPNTELFDNSIFGVFHDIEFLQNDNISDIKLSITGSAPCRQFVLNFVEAPHFGCPERSTTQLVLYELTNIIEVYVKDKPLSCDIGRSRNSLIGILNQDATIGYSPQNRNTGEWSAFNEAWRFQPNGSIPPNVEWYDSNNNLIGTGENISICDIDNTTYTAHVIYSNCNDSPGVIITDAIEVELDANLPLAVQQEFFLCSAANSQSTTIDLNDYLDEISVNNPQNFIISVHSSQSDAENNINPLGLTQTVSGNVSYYIRIESPVDPDCVSIGKVDFIVDTINLDLYTINLCDNLNDGIEEDIDLTQYISTTFSSLNFTELSFHSSLEDATNNESPITSTTISSDTEVYVNITFGSGCNEVFGPLIFNFIDAPTIPNSVPAIVVELCDIDYNHIEPYDWNTYINNNITSNPNIIVSVHASYDDAINNASATDQVSDNWDFAYIRVTNSNGCFNVIEVPLEVTFVGVDAVDYSQIICFDGTEDVQINLDDYIENLLNVSTDGITIGYFATIEDAQSNIATSQISNIQTIDEDGFQVSETFYIRFSLSADCYSIKRLNITLIHPEVQQNPISVCDISNDIQEDNILSLYDDYILGEQDGTVNYFLSEQDAINIQNEITSYNFTQSTVLWVRLTVKTCVEVYPVNFDLSSVINVNDLNVSLANLCNNNNLGFTFIDITQYEPAIYSDVTNVSYQYYRSYNEQSEEFDGFIENPTNFIIVNDIRLYAKVQPNEGGCYAVSSIDLMPNFLPSIQKREDVELFECDPEDNLNEEFDLNEASELIFIPDENYQLSDVQFSYFSELEEAINNINQLPYLYTPNFTDGVIYARIETIEDGCFTVAPLTLNVVAAPKAISNNHVVCDNNLNGLYDLYLNELDELVSIGASSIPLNFSYYLSQDDALLNINELDATQLYEADPFPEVIWVKVENIPNCFDIKPVSISFGTPIAASSTELTYSECDDDYDGFTVFNIQDFINDNLGIDNAEIRVYSSVDDLIALENPIEDLVDFTNTTAYSQTVFASVSLPELCPILITVELIVNPIADINVDDELLCSNNTIDIVPFVSGDAPFVYEWIAPDGSIIGTEPTLNNNHIFGDFILNVENAFGCVASTTFAITELVAPTIEELIVEEYNITVVASGVEAMEYSINGIDWQASNIFTNLEPSAYTVYVKYARTDQICEAIPAETVILDIKNVITPNADGFNDTWVIKHLDIFGEQDSQVYIYDRYGKQLFFESSNTRIEWDGTFNGRALPTTDYWYKLVIPDGREFSGSISLKNY